MIGQSVAVIGALIIVLDLVSEADRIALGRGRVTGCGGGYLSALGCFPLPFWAAGLVAEVSWARGLATASTNEPDGS